LAITVFQARPETSLDSISRVTNVSLSHSWQASQNPPATSFALIKINHKTVNIIQLGECFVIIKTTEGPIVSPTNPNNSNSLIDGRQRSLFLSLSWTINIELKKVKSVFISTISLTPKVSELMEKNKLEELSKEDGLKIYF